MNDAKAQTEDNDLQRQIDVLRDDFQRLEQVYHTTRETLEARIGALEDELTKHNETQKSFKESNAGEGETSADAESDGRRER